MGAHNAPLFCVISQSGGSNMKKKIETASGFKCTADDSVLDDMRLVDLIADMEKRPYIIGQLIEKLIGQANKEKLYAHHETKDGRVPVSTMEKEVAEIMEQLGGDDTAKK